MLVYARHQMIAKRQRVLSVAVAQIVQRRMMKGFVTNIIQLENLVIVNTLLHPLKGIRIRMLVEQRIR
jgi:hypothetical protein